MNESALFTFAKKKVFPCIFDADKGGCYSAVRLEYNLFPDIFLVSYTHKLNFFFELKVVNKRVKGEYKPKWQPGQLVNFNTMQLYYDLVIDDIAVLNSVNLMLLVQDTQQVYCLPMIKEKYTIDELAQWPSFPVI